MGLCFTKFFVKTGVFHESTWIINICVVELTTISSTVSMETTRSRLHVSILSGLFGQPHTCQLFKIPMGDFMH
jgi:hypothetical protein